MKKHKLLLGFAIGFFLEIVQIIRFLCWMYAILFALIGIGLFFSGNGSKANLPILICLAAIGAVTVLRWFVKITSIQNYYNRFRINIGKKPSLA